MRELVGSSEGKGVPEKGLSDEQRVRLFPPVGGARTVVGAFGGISHEVRAHASC